MRSRIHIELTRTDFPDSGIDRCSHGALTSNLDSCFYLLPLLLERMPWTETESSWLACYAFSVSYLEWTTQKRFRTLLYDMIGQALLQYWFVVVSGLKREISSPRLAFPFKHSDSCGPMPIAREQWKEIDECVQTKQGISASRWDWTYRLGTKGRSCTRICCWWKAIRKRRHFRA